MAPVQWICRTFPEAPLAVWHLDEDGGETIDRQHDLVKMLRRPNRFYSGKTMWMATLADFTVDGNAYWIKVKNRAGAVEELWWTPCGLLTPQGTPHEFISHYEYRPGGSSGSEAIVLDPSEVVHFRYGLDPEDIRKGHSPLKSVLREVFTDDEAATFTASLLTNMGIPGLLVSPGNGDHTPSEDDVKATKEYVSSEFSGDNRGTPLVMSGPTEIKQFGFSPEQMDLKALRRIPEERVTAVIGLPAIVAGLGAGLDRSTFSNFAEAREAAYESNIIPTQSLLAEEIFLQLLPDFDSGADIDSLKVGFDNSEVRVLQEDANKRAERMDSGVKAGVVKVSEARTARDLESGPEDDIYLRSLSVVEVSPGADYRGLVEPEPPLLPSPEALQQDEDLVYSGPPPVSAFFLDDRTKQTGTPRGATRAQVRLMQALLRQEQMIASAFQRELEEDFAGLGVMAAKAFDEIVANGADLSATNGARVKADEAIVSQIVASLRIAEWKNNVLRPRFEKNASRTSIATVATINEMMDLGVMLPDHVEQGIVKGGGTRAGLIDIENDTISSIFASIADGREAGAGAAVISQSIEASVPAGRFVHAGSSYRATLIARTETKWAQNQSSLATYKEAKSVEMVLAFDARLGESDEDCMARDGQEFTLEAAEYELGTEHPNGTLSFAPVVNPTRVTA